ncbi:hypothetical protein [Oceaniradius stylonematis]|uniref:hypothetical protein n=1 Tax=Oceaniradius stylonematis TaxID=2184161 RepID=UPI00273E5D81|nr:hypothetical protein [Oceaniradius stylonematis]
MYRLCPAEIVRYAKTRNKVEADAYRRAAQLEHFNASLQRAKRIKKFDAYMRKPESAGSLFERIRGAIRHAQELNDE